MNPNKPANLEVVFHRDLTEDQKLKNLKSGIETLPGEDYSARLASLIEHAKRFAEPMPNGKTESTEEGISDTVPATANFITPRRPILQTEKGILELDFFIYAPANGDNSSINAGWYLPGQDRPKRVLQEYLSARNFDDQVAAYREDSPQMLVLLEEALDAYERAADTTLAAE